MGNVTCNIMARPLTDMRSVAFRLIGSNTSTSMCGMLVFNSENSCCNEHDGCCERFLVGFDGRVDRFEGSKSEGKNDFFF